MSAPSAAERDKPSCRSVRFGDAGSGRGSAGPLEDPGGIRGMGAETPMARGPIGRRFNGGRHEAPHDDRRTIEMFSEAFSEIFSEAVSPRTGSFRYECDRRRTGSACRLPSQERSLPIGFWNAL